MPIRSFLKSIAIILSAGVAVGFAAVHFLKPVDKNRSLMYYSFSKLGADQNSRYLFDIKINASELSQTENEISIIKVNIEGLKDFNSDLIYTWTLPQDVELAEGALSGPLGDFYTNQNKEYILKVRGFSKQLKKFISFEVQGEFEQRPVRRDILISSRLEDSFEYSIQQNELNNSKNQLKNKIYKLGDAKPKGRFDLDRVVR